jgi:hypothetical protein
VIRALFALIWRDVRVFIAGWRDPKATADLRFYRWLADQYRKQGQWKQAADFNALAEAEADQLLEVMATKWKWIGFEDAKHHMVCASLAPAIKADLKARGHLPTKEQDAKTFGIDMPGMILVGRPFDEFKVCGLKVSIPCEDMATFILAVEKLEPRTQGTKTYYKLHGFLRCWVLTPHQKSVLLAQLKSRVLKAEDRACKFLAGRKSPAMMLREVAAKASGQPIESIPDLGGHRLDRFFGERGES